MFDSSSGLQPSQPGAACDRKALTRQMCVATMPDVLGGLQYNALVSDCGACLASPLDARHYTAVHRKPQASEEVPEEKLKQVGTQVLT